VALSAVDFPLIPLMVRPDALNFRHDLLTSPTPFE
jgi:hypothetical protein